MLYKSTPETRLVYADSSAFVGIGMTLRMHNQTDTVWLTDDDIVSDSFQLIQSISETEELNLGGCISSELTFEFDSSACNLGESGNTFGNGCRIRLYRICTTDSGTTMTGIGYFFVDSITENEFLGTYKVVAYDILHSVMNMSLDAFKDTIWDSRYTSVFNDGTRWMQLGIFRQFLIQTTRSYYTDSQGEYLFDYAPYISVIDGDSDYYLANDREVICISAIDYSKTNAVELLRSIAELNCCFGYINSWGKYDYIAYASNDFTTEQEMRILGEETLQIDQTQDDSFCKSFTRENYSTSQIVGVVVCSENDNLSSSSGTVSDGSNYYKVQGNTVLAYSDSITLHNMATNLNGLMNDPSLNDLYYPSEVEIELRPYMEVGDRYYSLYNTIDDDGNTTLKRFYGLVAKIIMKANLETLSIQGKNIRSNTETATQSANSASARAYVMQDKIERSVDAEVVKESDSYLYNASLSQAATDGTILDKISSQWLHADKYVDIYKGVSFGVPVGDGTYKYTMKVGLSHVVAVRTSGSSDPGLAQNQLVMAVRGTSYDISTEAYVNLYGEAEIEVIANYPNIFLVQDVDVNVSSAQPVSLGFPPEVFTHINEYNFSKSSEFQDIASYILQATPDSVRTNGLRVLHPVSATTVEEVNIVSATIKDISLHFDMSPFRANEYTEEYKENAQGTIISHRWAISNTYDVQPLEFNDVCEIDTDNTEISTNLSTLTVRFDVREAHQTTASNIGFYNVSRQKKVNDIEVDFKVGLADFKRVPTSVPLSADDEEMGAYYSSDKIVWADSETSIYTSGNKIYTVITDYPYMRFRASNYNRSFYGSLPNLVRQQQFTVKLIQTSTQKKYTDTIEGWQDIDVDIGEKPYKANDETIQLASETSCLVEQSKLIVGTTYDPDTGTYAIDVDNSDSEMYELYLKLLNYSETNNTHIFESGTNNKYDIHYNSFDIIGSNNDLLDVNGYGKQLTIIGSNNDVRAFEGYSDGLEGIFIGSFGSGMLITESGEIVHYTEYLIDAPEAKISYELKATIEVTIIRFKCYRRGDNVYYDIEFQPNVPITGSINVPLIYGFPIAETVTPISVYQMDGNESLHATCGCIYKGMFYYTESYTTGGLSTDNTYIIKGSYSLK